MRATLTRSEWCLLSCNDSIDECGGSRQACPGLRQSKTSPKVSFSLTGRAASHGKNVWRDVFSSMKMKKRNHSRRIQGALSHLSSSPPPLFDSSWSLESLFWTKSRTEHCSPRSARKAHPTFPCRQTMPSEASPNAPRGSDYTQLHPTSLFSPPPLLFLLLLLLQPPHTPHVLKKTPSQPLITPCPRRPQRPAPINATWTRRPEARRRRTP